MTGFPSHPFYSGLHAAAALQPGDAHMSLFAMDSIIAIGLGLCLRVIVDSASHHSQRVGSSLVGLWEGAVLYHFLEKWPRSFDPYVAFGFRLFVDFLFTESLARLTIVMLWAAMGMILSDVTPAFWYDKSVRRFYRRTRRYIKDFDLASLSSIKFPKLPKLPISASTISRVRFSMQSPRTTMRTATSSSGGGTSSNGSSSTSVFTPPVPILRKRPVPGAFPGYTSESSAATSAMRPRRPVAASSLPPSVSNASSSSKNESVDGFELVPPASDLPSIEDLYEDRAPSPTSHTTPLPIPIPPPMPIPEPFVHSPPPMPVPEIVEHQPPMDELTDISLPDEPMGPRGMTPPPSFDEVARMGKAAAVAGPSSLPSPDVDLDDTPRSSIIYGGNRGSIISRADLLREEALKEEKERDRLKFERKRALEQGRHADAVRYKVEEEEAHERVMALHRQAARRYFKAHNLASQPHIIDVHRLRVPEAVRQTEIAVRDTLNDGANELRVITGKGNHSVGKLPVLKLAIIRVMGQEHNLNTEVDPKNPGVVVIKLPVS